ncbi:MAG: Wzz/FepE/Etk N-terminal domain-containing protein [Burkholderiaceae bacterium]|nr:Wzz/FepE/Etk N-terminal domain-containing protein [Burkholderiaceae bacterium]
MHVDQIVSTDRGEAVSLADLWRVFVHRKLLILVTFAACVAVGLGYAFLTSPVYEASARIRIGQVAGNGPIEPVDLVSARVMARYGEVVAIGVKRTRPFLSRAVAPRGVSGVVELVAVGDTPNDAVALLEKVHAEIQQVHDDVYRRGISLIEEELQEIEARRALLTQQLEASVVVTERLGEQDFSRTALLTIERARMLALLAELDAQKPILAQKLLLPQTTPTQLVDAITPPSSPTAPRRFLAIGIAVVLGLIAGLMLALLTDFLDRARRR